MGNFGARLLIRLILIGVVCLGFFVYERFFEKPRFNYNAAPATPAGWTQLEVPEGHYSFALPPGFLIADSSRADYAKNVATLKASSPTLAKNFEADAARSDRKRVAAYRFDAKAVHLLEVIVKDVESDEATDDSAESVEAIRKEVAAEYKDSQWDRTESLQTPLGKAFVWPSRTKSDEDDITVGQVTTGFLDKHDLYLVQVTEAPDSPQAKKLSTDVANTLRVTKH